MKNFNILIKLHPKIFRKLIRIIKMDIYPKFVVIIILSSMDNLHPFFR
jgi:hypothetical protein